MQAGWNQRWSAAIAGSGFVAVAAGFAAHRMWQVLPWERFALSLLLAAIGAGLAWPIARVARLPMATAILLVWLLAALGFIGVLPCLAAALLALAAWSAGSRLLPGAAPAAAAIAAALGLSLIGGVAGWLLPLPVHAPWAWVLALLALVARQRHHLRTAIGSLADAWQGAVSKAPRASAGAVMLLGLASTACWFPTLQADDLAYHLGLPSQLLAHDQYLPVARHQMWAHAPWLGDTLHGIGFLLANGDARGAVNLLWLAIAAGAAWALAAALRADAPQRWASVALLGSFPPLVWLAAGMQTELPAIALLLALAAVAVSNHPGRLWAVAILSGGLLALKLIHGLSALPLLGYALWRMRGSLGGRRVLVAAGLCLLVAGSSYVSAWWHTGNPVFPLFNAWFQSPDYPPRDFADPRWHTGFGPLLPWRLVFGTDRFFEAWDGAIGFALVALAGGTVLAIGNAATRGLALVACMALLLTLLPIQYARYAFPALALLAVVSLPALRDALPRRTGAWLLAGLCVLNLAFQANASWLHHSAALKRLIRAGGDETTLFVHYAPERQLLRSLPAGICHRVLATDPQRSAVAELAGCGRTVSGHDPLLADLRAAADRDDSGQRWHALIRRSGAQWLLVTPAQASTGLRSGLRRAGAIRDARVGDAELWRLPDREAGPDARAP